MPSRKKRTRARLFTLEICYCRSVDDGVVCLRATQIGKFVLGYVCLVSHHSLECVIPFIWLLTPTPWISLICHIILFIGVTVFPFCETSSLRLISRRCIITLSQEFTEKLTTPPTLCCLQSWPMRRQTDDRTLHNRFPFNRVHGINTAIATRHNPRLFSRHYRRLSSAFCCRFRRWDVCSLLIVHIHLQLCLLDEWIFMEKVVSPLRRYSSCDRKMDFASKFTFS